MEALSLLHTIRHNRKEHGYKVSLRRSGAQTQLIQMLKPVVSITYSVRGVKTEIV